MNTDICCMKRTLEAQTNACESLWVVTGFLDDRLNAMEKPCGPPSMDSSGVKADGQMPETTGETIDNNPGQATAAALYRTSGQTQSPAWSVVVKEGRRLKSVPENSATQIKPRSAQATVRHERKLA